MSSIKDKINKIKVSIIKDGKDLPKTLPNSMGTILTMIQNYQIPITHGMNGLDDSCFKGYGFTTVSISENYISLKSGNNHIVLNKKDLSKLTRGNNEICDDAEDVEEIDEDEEYNKGWNDCVDHIEEHLRISKFMKRG